MKTGLLYGIVASSKTRVRCLFCGVHIPKATRCIEQHTNGAKHKENMELMNENGLSFSNDALHCKPCKRSLSVDDCAWKHIEAEDHANWMAAAEDLVDGEFVSLDTYLSGESDDVFCEVCNTHFNCSLQVIESHVNNISHRTNIIDRLKPLNGIFNADNNKVWCKVCNKYLDNNVKDIFAHLDDDVLHMEWFMEIDDIIDNQDMSIQAFLASEYENHAYCNKCNVDVLCTTQSLENHVNSDAHLNQFEL